MATVIKLKTTQIRHDKIFARYTELLKKAYKEDPHKMASMTKGYFYEKLAAEFGHDPVYIGLIIQKTFKRLGVPAPGKKRRFDNSQMDERVRFILDL